MLWKTQVNADKWKQCLLYRIIVRHPLTRTTGFEWRVKFYGSVEFLADRSDRVMRCRCGRGACQDHSIWLHILLSPKSSNVMLSVGILLRGSGHQSRNKTCLALAVRDISAGWIILDLISVLSCLKITRHMWVFHSRAVQRSYHAAPLGLCLIQNTKMLTWTGHYP